MGTDAALIWMIGIASAMAVIIPFYLRQRKLERRAEEAEVEALRYGLHEPASLHPVVDIGYCINTGACVSVCPEGDVLGIRGGQAHPISPARCIGHGLCERACPVEAIQLVFGTEKRGVDIPRIQANFETNVPGLYIVGELGGMGLIRNAFEQGRQCVEGMPRPNGGRAGDVKDLLIVGSGPAGLSASLHAAQHGLNFLTVEREDQIGGTVRHYPRKKLVLTEAVKVPGYGRIGSREILKEELIEIWEDIAATTGLEVNTGETVESVTPGADGVFSVTTSKASYRARRVILAIGRRGVPRRLGVPGEQLPKVAYSLREPEHFSDDRILVVGGGDSAVEAALALAEQPGNDVKISYRKGRFSRIKPRNLERIEAGISEGAVEPLWSTNLVAIEPDSVAYTNGSSGRETLPNDQVFVFIGGELPTKFLDSCGVAIDTKFGEP